MHLLGYPSIENTDLATISCFRQIVSQQSATNNLSTLEFTQFELILLA